MLTSQSTMSVTKITSNINILVSREGLAMPRDYSNPTATSFQSLLHTMYVYIHTLTHTHIRSQYILYKSIVAWYIVVMVHYVMLCLLYIGMYVHYVTDILATFAK